MATQNLASSRAPKPARPAPAVAAEHPAVPAPRFDFAWAALVFAVCTLALGLPALRGGFLVNPMSDQFIGGYPVRNFAAESLKAGTGIPLWNPYLFGGLPYVAAMHGDIFYPTFLLRAILPTDVAMTWSFMIHVFLAGLFTYGFLRAWGLGFLPSLVGGLAYMMCGPIAAYVAPGHDGKLYVSALFPLALWLLIRGIRDGRNWAWGVLAIVIGLAVLSPHPQLLQYMLLGCGAFSLYLAFGTLSQPGGRVIRLDRATALRRLGAALCAVLLGGVIGAVQYLPVIEYIPYSPRAGGRGYDYATSFSLPLEELINTYLPQFSGILDRYWGRNVIHFHSEYLGAAALFLAGAGLRTSRVGFRWFWVGTLVVTLLWALGGSTPFYHLVYAIVPGTRFFRAPSTILFVIAFSIAVLAALGTERLLALDIGRRYVLGWLMAAGVVAVLASVGALNNMAQVIAASFPEDSWTSYRPELIANNNAAVVFGAWRSFLAVGLVAAVAWLHSQGRVSLRAVTIAIPLLLALDFLSVEKQYWMFSSRAAAIYRVDPALDFVRKQPQPGRVLAEPLAPLATRDVMLRYDGPMVHGIRLVTGYHGNELGRYQRLGGASPDTRYEPGILLSPAFWRHENVRFLYTNADPQAVAQFLARLSLPNLEKVIGPVTDASGSIVYLYRLPGDNPFAWLAPAFVKASDEQALATVLDPRFDPTRVAILDTSSSIPAQQIQSLPEPLNIPVRVLHYAPGNIRLELASPSPPGSALIASENYFPGWSARADGKPAAVDRVQYNLIGVQLPAASRVVELRFDDRAYERGRLITIIAIVVALMAAGIGVAASRRANG
jgi:hypothetical protein